MNKTRKLEDARKNLEEINPKNLKEFIKEKYEDYAERKRAEKKKKRKRRGR